MKEKKKRKSKPRKSTRRGGQTKREQNKQTNT
jgi:hypothetical protein